MNTKLSTLFPVGEQVLVDLSGSKSSCKGTIVGAKDKQYLIIDFPFIRDFGDEVVGASCEGQMIVSGILLRISFKIMHLDILTNLVMFITWPEIIDQRQLRSSTRVQCSLPVVVTFLVGRQSCDAVITDISTGGCQLKTSLSLYEYALRSRYSHITITFNVATITNIEYIFGKIISVDIEKIHTIMKVRFEKLPESSIFELKKFIEYSLI